MIFAIYISVISAFGARTFSVDGPTVGIHCLIICAIQLLTPNNVGGTWNVSVRRTFETLAHLRCYVIALYKSTFTYLLTYLDHTQFTRANGVARIFAAECTHRRSFIFRLE